MKIIGITGGIGSGKTTISNMLRKQGYPVFDSDVQSKYICDHDIYVINEIKKHFGKNIYVDDRLDRKSLAEIVFNDKGSLNILNSIIHPKTRDFMCGAIEDSDSELFFVESAIMFEYGLDELMDYIISVTAPLDVRMERIILRDNTTKDKIDDRMNNQMSEKDRLSKSDYIISTNQSLHQVGCKLNRIIIDIKIFITIFNSGFLKISFKFFNRTT